MTRIMIVDDEFLIRVGIKSCIDWEKHGFEVTGMAEDGVRAMELMKTAKPDIVLTDIRMPNMDGLKLIEKLAEEYPKVKTIVLSCYNELDYVKGAMRLGACDYILKLSTEPDALLEVLQKAGREIQEEKRKTESLRESEKGLERNRYILKEDLFRKYVGGAIDLSEFRNGLDHLRTDLECRSFRIICCGIDDYMYAPVKSRMDNHYLLKFSFVNIMEESMAGFYKNAIAEIENGRYLVFLGFESDSENRGSTEVLFKRVNTSLKTYLNISVSFGVASLCADMGKIRDRFWEACEALEYRFYRGKECFVSFADIPAFADGSVFIEAETENLLALHLENMYWEGAGEIIKSFVDHVREKKHRPSNVRIAAVELLHSLIKAAKRYGLDPDPLLPDCGIHPVDMLMNAETASDIQSYLEDFVNRLASQVIGQRSSGIRPEIAKIKSYILQHLKEDISLEAAAKLTGISRCYFSTVFKKETGESFTDYVNRVKMEKAKDMLLTTDLRNYEVAEEIGITDESYFSKLFKKYWGTSPTHFRNKPAR